MRNPGPCESTTCAQLLHPSSFLACSQVTSATRTSLDSVDPTRPRQRTQQPVRHCRSVPRATGSEIQNFLFCPFCSDHSLNRSPTKKKEKTRAFATPPHTPPKEEKKEGPSHAQAATATQQVSSPSHCCGSFANTTASGNQAWISIGVEVFCWFRIGSAPCGPSYCCRHVSCVPAANQQSASSFLLHRLHLQARPGSFLQAAADFLNPVSCI